MIPSMTHRSLPFPLDIRPSRARAWSPRRWVATALAVGCAGLVEAQTVRVVDGFAGPGSAYVTVTAAVNAAVDGDVVLIRAGVYPEVVVIDGKSVILHSEVSAAVEIHGLEVSNLSPAQLVAVRGVNVRPDFTFGGATTIHDNEGVVWLEDIEALGVPFFGTRAVTVADSQAVVMRNCQLASNASVVGQATLLAVRSKLYVYETSVIGDSGYYASGIHGTRFLSDGCEGIRLSESAAWLYGSTVAGGAGGSLPTSSLAGADGGDAVELMSSEPVELWTLGAVASGGAGGIGGSGTPDGAAGMPYALNGQTHVEIVHTPRYESISSPTREHESLATAQAGVPGDWVWTFFSASPRLPLTGRTWDGPFAVGAPFTGFRNGSIPASGIQLGSPTLGELGPGVEAVGVFAQSMMRDAATGRFIASAPTFLLLLDEAF